jgi:hypothetical protein
MITAASQRVSRYTSEAGRSRGGVERRDPVANRSATLSDPGSTTRPGAAGSLPFRRSPARLDEEDA